jgi:hypothetical protein
MPFMETTGALQCSQEPSTGTYAEQDGDHHHPSFFFKTHFITSSKRQSETNNKTNNYQILNKFRLNGLAEYLKMNCCHNILLQGQGESQEPKS